MSKQREFEQWMKMVDSQLEWMTGFLDSKDLADQPYRDWFDDGMQARLAAREVLVNEGFPGF
jgi:hypothetical protein